MRKWLRFLACALAVVLAASLTACSSAPTDNAVPAPGSSVPSASSAPQDNARAAVVDDFAGEVTATSDGDELSAFRGLALLRRDSLETGAESWSSLELGEEQFVLIEENSKVSIARLTDDAKSTELKMNDGKLWISISKKLADDESFVVRTPTCALTVRGTVFAVEYNENSCRVAVYEGTVLLHAEDENGSPILDENGNEVLLEISAGKAEITVKDGVVTLVRQTALGKEDLAPLYAQGDAGPGGLFSVLRGRLPKLVWDDGTATFSEEADMYTYYAHELKTFLESGKSGYSVMLKDIDCDGVEELVTYWEEPSPYDGDGHPEGTMIYTYEFAIYDWEGGKKRPGTWSGSTWLEPIIFMSDTGYLIFTNFDSTGETDYAFNGMIYDHSRAHSILGPSADSTNTEMIPGPNPTRVPITDERFTEMCEVYGLKLRWDKISSQRYIVMYELGESLFPYADTQKDILRLLPDYTAP